jgi:hypothetical protein
MGSVVALALLAAAGGARAEVQTFTFTGAEQSFTVPAGVTSIQVTAIGGKGGGAPMGAAGGFGAFVQATLAVTPGAVLYVAVGGNGASDLATGAGGFNGGGSGGQMCGPNGCDAGGGGGASDVRTCPRALAACPGGGSTLDSRLVVAGGGGGGGGGGSPLPVGGAAAKSGTADGGDGGAVPGSANGGPGHGATQSAGGTGGVSGSCKFSIPGQPGTYGQGSSSGNHDNGCTKLGGGGGGGVWGGSAGGSGNAGGGGGAGSSLAFGASGASFATDNTGVPSVAISYTPPSGGPGPGPGGGTAPDTAPPTATILARRTQKLGRRVSVTVVCSDEDCSAEAAGTLSVPKASKVFKLRKVTKTLKRGVPGRLSIPIPKAARAGAARALRARKRVTVNLSVSIFDLAKNSTTKKIKLRLR